MRCVRFEFGVLALLVAGGAASRVEAQAGTPAFEIPIPISSVALEPGSPGEIGYFVQGATMYAFRNAAESGPEGGPAGTIKWAWSIPSGRTIQNYPSPVTLSGGSRAIFLGGDDGFLYRVDAQTGTTVGSFDTRRATCGADQVVATPAVQLYSYSNSTFQAAVLSQRGSQDDLVFVVTKNGCGTTTGNRVLALWASDLTEKWTFNASGVHPVDHSSQGCTIDYASNGLYLGTSQSQGTTQHSLWALDALSGALRWSGNAGSIQNRPILYGGRLYVGNLQAVLSSIDPANGVPHWTYPTGAAVTRNLWVEFRQPYQGKVFYTTADGMVHSVEDAGTMAVPNWSYGPGVDTAPTVSPTFRKVFVGRDDGTIQQLNIDTGVPEFTQAVGPPGGPTDAVILKSTDGVSDVPRLVVTTSAQRGCAVKQFCVPLNASTCSQLVDVPGLPEQRLAGLEFGPGAPNPFGGNTAFRYRLPSRAHVEVTIFDPQGARVRTLLEFDQAPGPHEVEWNGLDDDASPVASGVYFCRLRVTDAAGIVLQRTSRTHLLR